MRNISRLEFDISPHPFAVCQLTAALRNFNSIAFSLESSFFKYAALPVCSLASHALQMCTVEAEVDRSVHQSRIRMEPPTANWRAKLLKTLRTLNLFDSESTDANIIQRERWSTRVYVVLLCLLMLSLTIYSAQVSRTILVTRSQPTEDQFVQLYARYPNTLTCPCSRVAIQYREIVRSQVAFHEVCQSHFISQENIDASYGANASFLSPVDIRTTLSAFWQVVRSFCTLSKNTWTDVQTDFNGTLLLSPAAQPPSLIETQVQTSLKFSLATALNDLQRNLLVTQETARVNGLVSALATNYHFTLRKPWGNKYTPSVQLETNSFVDGCSCATGNGCPRSAVVFASDGTFSSTNVPGMMFNCLPLDAALASSLQCFYDLECLSLIHPPTSKNEKPSPLGVSRRFPHNATLQMLLSELMIEKNKTIVLYSSYYAECRPPYCSYSYSRRFYVLFMITLLVSAYGGISAALRLFIPLLIRLAFMVYKWKKRHSSVGIGKYQHSISHRKNRKHRWWCVCIRFLLLGQSVTTRLRSLPGKLRKYLVELNLFKRSSRRTDARHEQRFTTRLFLIVLGISLVAISSYAFLSTQTETITIDNPSLDDYDHLWQLYRDSLRCPCSQIAIKYSSFVEITPIFHQVCSSYIISPIWYSRLILLNTNQSRVPYVFEDTLGANYFQGLSTFCSLAKTTAVNAYRLFSANNLISNRAPSRTLFDDQVNASVRSFISTTRIEFISIFSLIRRTMRTSQFAAQAFTNFIFYPDKNGHLVVGDKPIPVPFNKPGSPILFLCSCLNLDSRCGTNARVLDSLGRNNVSDIPNMVVRCIPTESVLTSSLECWYDPHCFGLVTAAYARKGVLDLNRTVPLNTNISSRFSANATFAALMEELMLESWTINTSYEKFFSQCAPLSCSYTVENRFSWLFVVVTVLSVYGGLNKGLRLGLPILVRLGLLVVRRIRMKLRPVTQPVPTGNNNQSAGQSTHTINLARKVRRYLSAYNLFESSTSTPETHRREILKTRLYLVLVITSSILLVLYTGLAEQTSTVTVQQPSQSTYEHLRSLHSDSLQCPCASVSIPHKAFTVHLEAVLHPICSSGFITDKWLTFFNIHGAYYTYWLQRIDFRKWGILFFNFLQLNCQLTNSTIADAIEQFQSSSFISSTAMSSTQFSVQINGGLERLQKSTSALLVRPLDVFRASAQGNAFITIGGNNWLFMLTRDETRAPLTNTPITYSNGTCSCATSSSCFESAAFYNYTQSRVYTIDGIFRGCLFLDSVLRSSLSCFFSNACLSDLVGSMNLGNPLPVGSTPKINSSIAAPLQFALPNSRFKANDTVETIFNQLFIDSWFNETSYERYFNACAPTHCTYSFARRLNVLYALTTFISVFSGLATFFRFFVSCVVKVAFKLLRLS